MKCKWCEKEIRPLEDDGDECHDCWELRTRIERKPYIALRMLSRVKKKETDDN